jgi:hypothetical protein
MKRVEIDLNVRTARGTYSGFEHCSEPVEVFDVVHVVEPESGMCGEALVTAVDEERRLVYLALAWKTLAPLAPSE